MRFTLASVVLGGGVASAQSLLGLPLDIGALLSSLKPADANDPRFRDFHPPGIGDGMFSDEGENGWKNTNNLSSPITMPRS
jgi:hypothetical protein